MAAANPELRRRSLILASQGKRSFAVADLVETSIGRSPAEGRAKPSNFRQAMFGIEVDEELGGRGSSLPQLKPLVAESYPSTAAPSP